MHDLRASEAVSLVFHPLGPGPASARFADAARAVCDAAPDGELRLVSPYLGAAPIGTLTANRAFRLVTDLAACLAQPDGEALERFLACHVEAVRDRPGVHAKVVLTDGALLLGSANLTKEGFAERDELGCCIRDPALVAEACRWFESLWTAATVVTVANIHEAADRGRDLAKRSADAGLAVRTGLPRKMAGQARVARRSLGWLGAPGKPRPVPIKPALPPPEREDPTAHDDLVRHLRRLTASAAEARTVLDLCWAAIEASGLARDNPQLHLNFGKRYLSVTVGQRFVAWGCKHARGAEFAFILADRQLAQRTEAAIAGAWAGSFGTRRGRPDSPTLHVPVSRLGELPEAFIADWKKAIRAEADRRTRAGQAPISSYGKHKRPYLFDALQTAEGRARLAHAAHASGQ